MKQIVLTGICLFLLSIQASAQTIYVTDSVKAMFRTGPGNDHKIMSTVSSGERLTVIEKTEKWSKVRRASGTEGWVLNQWLSEEVPNGIRLQSLESKHEKLKANYTRLKSGSGECEDENKTLKEALAISRKKERDSRTAYENLKKASANYLKLETEYKSVKEKLEKLSKDSELLNDQLIQKNITWFLTGAGVLFIGILIGFSSRRQRRSSY